MKTKKHLAPQLALTPERILINNVTLKDDDLIRLWKAYLHAQEIQPSATQAVARLVERGLKDWQKEKGL